jgi:aerobactin synthase
MVAKILAELEYERTLRAEPLSSDAWRITMGNASWQFCATRGIWGWLHIDPDSLTTASGDAVEAESAAAAGDVLEMSDAQTAEHMEDLYATLRGDMQLLQARDALDADALIHLDPDELQCLMRGHPKFIFNKGRRGWGLDALRQYAPEYRGRFRLHWVAVQRGIWSGAATPIAISAPCWRAPWTTPSAPALTPAGRRWASTRAGCRCRCTRGSGSRRLPFISSQLARGEMVELGEFGDEYLAQQSLRTLTNASRRAPFDIKLPLTIYNTSCYRGIPGKYIAAGPLASRWLQQQLPLTLRLPALAHRCLANPPPDICRIRAMPHCRKRPTAIRRCWG